MCEGDACRDVSEMLQVFWVLGLHNCIIQVIHMHKPPAAGWRCSWRKTKFGATWRCLSCNVTDRDLEIDRDMEHESDTDFPLINKRYLNKPSN